MGAMDYTILKPAGSHSLGDPRNLEDVFVLTSYTNECRQFTTRLII